MTTTPRTSMSLEAERAVLGTMMFSAPARQAAASTLHACHFSREPHRKLFTAMVAMELGGRAVDLVTLTEEIRRRDELEQVGGITAIAALAESATGPTNLEHHAAIVRAHWRTREVARLGESLAQSAADPTITATLLRELADLDDATSSTDDRWHDASCWVADLLARDIVQPAYVISDGEDGAVLPAGGLGFLVAAGGSGKTFLSLQLARAVATEGETWLGLPTAQVRVGIIEGEMTEFSCQKRLRELDAGGNDPWIRNVRILSKPRGGTILSRNDTARRLRAFIQRNDLKLCILDPLNRFHLFGEGSLGGEEETLAAIYETCDATGCALFFLHHVRKLPSGLGQDSTSRVSAMHSGKGSSRWSDDADCFITIEEAKGLHRVRFAKVRHGKEPADVWLKRTEAGFFEVAQDPSQIGDTNHLKIEQLVRATGASGMTMRDLLSATGLSKRTVTRHLHSCGAELVGGSNNPHARWIIAEEEKRLDDQSGW